LACIACPPAPTCPLEKACPPEKTCPACPTQAKQQQQQQQQQVLKGGEDPLAGWAERLQVPWGPLLSEAEARRGLSYYGSGARLQEVAAKLMAGKPIKVFTLGASVTRGIGTTDRKYSYPARFFEYINSTFPHK
jgi:hypothetical protein